MNKSIWMLFAAIGFVFVQTGCGDSVKPRSLASTSGETTAGADASTIRGETGGSLTGEQSDGSEFDQDQEPGGTSDADGEVVTGGGDTVPNSPAAAGAQSESSAGGAQTAENAAAGNTAGAAVSDGSGGSDMDGNGGAQGDGTQGDEEAPPFEATVACTADANCPAGQTCQNGLCENDLQNAASDTVRLFRLQGVEVFEPAAPCDGLIEAVLMPISQRNTFNLLLEPGGYVDNEGGYLWYIGNGAHYTDNSFHYLTGYPVQNFVGRWRQNEGESPYWLYEEMSPFLLNVPSGTRDVSNADGTTSSVRCYSQLNIPVTDLRITPEYETTEDEEGEAVSDRNISPTLNMVFRGFLAITDADVVEFELNGITTPLTRILSTCETVDRTGDGIGDSYPFHFEGVIREVVPNANLELPLPDGSNRDPEAVWENPPECQ